MKFSPNQDAFGWILLLLSCFAFVVCGAREEERVDASQARSTNCCSLQTNSSKTTFDERFAPRLGDAFAPLSEISELMRLSVRRSATYGTSRRARLCEFVARERQTSTTRLIFELSATRLFRPRSFWASSFLSNPLFITFLTLRN